MSESANSGGTGDAGRPAPRAAVRAIDPSQLPKHFDAEAISARWDGFWQEEGVYHYDPARSRAETFVVDTPPPTASGSLHIGHVFSYTQADVVVRYKRMTGMNIFYPMGWDDNGLPTERRVQNYYHIRCDPNTPYEAGLRFEQASAETRKKPARLVSRPNFIEACFDLIKEDEKAFSVLWHRLGLSVDWRQEYQTIDAHCRRVAQLSFRDLFEKRHVYTSEAPMMWDVDFQSAIAQAEIEDKPTPGAFHRIEFAVEGDASARFVIATTRPELLPACVGVTAHPDDPRYKPFFGKRAITPLFKAPVPIFPSEVADPEKGTGILMVCTFGDQTDVQWWRTQGLALRQVVGNDGRLRPVDFARAPFESLDPARANAAYAEIAGKTVKQAQAKIVELLRDPAGSATGGGAPLVAEPEPIQHSVKYYEKGDRPLELIPTRQWFCRLLDHKEALIAKGEQVEWHPAHMRTRFRDWTENLSIDWCLSRQRYFGVPIPVWYPLDASGSPDYDHPIVADAASMPIDPTTDVPKGFVEAQRGKPGGFVGDPDVFDTWFTSSLTPQISSHWGVDPERHARLFPADVRPQGHDIIRTWAFYTIAKALLHEDTVPWHHALISGWILDPDRKKMSKSKGNVMTPLPLIETYTADAARYWAASARLGADTAFDENVWKIGKRLVTKLFNAAKFVLMQPAEPAPILHELDRAFVAQLRALVESSTKNFDAYQYAHALQETETFFWTRFTDTYLELTKVRARGEGTGTAKGRSAAEADIASGSAVAALRLGLSVLLRLFAPVLPFITEEIWSWSFAAETAGDAGGPGAAARRSIHRAAWPDAADFAGISAPDHAESFDVAIAALAAINKAKADAAVSMGRDVVRLVLRAAPATLEVFAGVRADVLAAARVTHCEVVPVEAIPAGELAVQSIEFAEKPTGEPAQ
ncbi:MAG: valine--tRNA ligase [Deltaproteobacteria bacterium]|nr:valine--tRNA ligase [Deltaproteobacteria bacterium]